MGTKKRQTKTSAKKKTVTKWEEFFPPYPVHLTEEDFSEPCTLSDSSFPDEFKPCTLTDSDFPADFEPCMLTDTDTDKK